MRCRFSRGHGETGRLLTRADCGEGLDLLVLSAVPRVPVQPGVTVLLDFAILRRLTVLTIDATPNRKTAYAK